MTNQELVQQGVEQIRADALAQQLRKLRLFLGLHEEVPEQPSLEDIVRAYKARLQANVEAARRAVERAVAAEREAWLRAAVMDRGATGSWQGEAWGPWYCLLGESWHQTREKAEEAAIRARGEPVVQKGQSG